MTEQLTPARVSPPGRILKKELVSRGWTQEDLAGIIGRPVQAISEIINGKKQITAETALQLADALGISAEFWLNLEANYQLHLSRRAQKEQGDEIAQRKEIYKAYPVSEMLKRKWIEKTNSAKVLEQQVCRFLGITTIQDMPIAVSFRCSLDRQPNSNAQIAWLRRVEQVTQNQIVASFDPDQLRQGIPSLLEYAKHPKDVASVGQRLNNLGVYFVIVPHLQKTYLDGAAFHYVGHPVVALTLRYKRIDWFWFTLMHELAHIALGHTGIYLDSLENNTEQSPTKSPEEEQADQQAGEWIINPTLLEAFAIEHAPYFSQEKIEAFAHTLNLHPGIVLGRLHYKKYVDFKNLRKLLVNIDEYLTDWIYD